MRRPRRLRRFGRRRSGRLGWIRRIPRKSSSDRASGERPVRTGVARAGCAGLAASAGLVAAGPAGSGGFGGSRGSLLLVRRLGSGPSEPASRERDAPVWRAPVSPPPELESRAGSRRSGSARARAVGAVPVLLDRDLDRVRPSANREPGAPDRWGVRVGDAGGPGSVRVWLPKAAPSSRDRDGASSGGAAARIRFRRRAKTGGGGRSRGRKWGANGPFRRRVARSSFDSEPLDA